MLRRLGWCWEIQIVQRAEKDQGPMGWFNPSGGGPKTATWDEGKCILLSLPAQSITLRLVRSSNGLTKRERAGRKKEPGGSKVGWSLGAIQWLQMLDVLRTVCSRLRGGSGQEEWTMRDKIPVPGSSGYDIECHFFVGAPGCSRREA